MPLVRRVTWHSRRTFTQAIWRTAEPELVAPAGLTATSSTQTATAGTLGFPPSGISYVTGSEIAGNVNTNVTSYVPDTWPSNLLAGDLVILYVTAGVSGTPVISATAPGGASYDAGTQVDATATARMRRLSRAIASNGEGAPTINFTVGSHSTCAGFALRGADPTTPMDVAETSATAGATSLALPNLSVATDGAWLLAGMSVRVGAAPYPNLTAGSGYTERVERKYSGTGAGTVTAASTRDNPVTTGGNPYNGSTFSQDSTTQRIILIHTAVRPAPAAPSGGLAATSVTATSSQATLAVAAPVAATSTTQARSLAGPITAEVVASSTTQTATTAAFSLAVPFAAASVTATSGAATLAVTPVPLTISGCHLLLRPEGLAAFANGAGISAWTDESGFSNSPAQATGSAQPTKVDNAINGLAAALFDPVASQRLRSATADVLTAFNNVPGATMFAVCAPNLEDSTDRQLVYWSTNVVGARRAGLFKTNPSPGNIGVGGRRLDADASSSITETTAATSGTWAVHCGVLDYANALASIYRNGTLETGPTTFLTAGNTSATDSVAVGIGSSSAVVGGGFWPGHIAEIIVYNRVLTSTERQTVTDYLINRYAITLGGLTAVSTTQARSTAGLTTAVPVGATSTTQTGATGTLAGGGALVATSVTATLGVAALGLAQPITATSTTQTLDTATMFLAVPVAATSTTQTLDTASLALAQPVTATSTTQSRDTAGPVTAVLVATSTVQTATLAGPVTAVVGATSVTQTLTLAGLAVAAPVGAASTTQSRSTATLAGAGALAAASTTQSLDTAALQIAQPLTAASLTQTSAAAVPALAVPTAAASLTQSRTVAGPITAVVVATSITQTRDTATMALAMALAAASTTQVSSQATPQLAKTIVAAAVVAVSSSGQLGIGQPVAVTSRTMVSATATLVVIVGIVPQWRGRLSVGAAGPSVARGQGPAHVASSGPSGAHGG